MSPVGVEPAFQPSQGCALSIELWGLIGMMVRRGWDSNPQDPIKGQSLANSCNNHYTTSPFIFILTLKTHKVNLLNINFHAKKEDWRSRIVAIAPVLKTGTLHRVRGFESHLLRIKNIQLCWVFFVERHTIDKSNRFVIILIGL